jgi:hypothetical protein
MTTDTAPLSAEKLDEIEARARTRAKQRWTDAYNSADSQLDIDLADRIAMLRRELAMARSRPAAEVTGPQRGDRFLIDHDGFVGTVIGEYQRLDGKRGVVLQQDGTTVVHVYGEKWLKPAAIRALKSPEPQHEW